MIMIPLLNNTFWAKLVNGVWIYKANSTIPFTKQGVLKQQYKDLPRYDIIYEWEEETMDEYKKGLQVAIKQLSRKLFQLIK